MLQKEEISKIAIAAIQNEGTAILDLSKSISTDFLQIIELLAQTKGRVILTGIGKSAIVAQKIVATFNSTGTPALFMHAADAIHGDLGMVQEEDTIIIISQSGESPEIKALVSLLKSYSNKLIAMVGNKHSFLAKHAQHILPTPIKEEACPNNLAPTTSTTVQMVVGDVLAVCLMHIKDFRSEQFAKFHPGGALGKKLYLTAADLCSKNAKPKVALDTNCKEVILEISANRLGITVVCDPSERILGVITDGDLRRAMEKDIVFSQLNAKDMMSSNVKTVTADTLAINTLQLMKEKDITQVVVVQDNKYYGIVHIHDIINEGIL